MTTINGYGITRTIRDTGGDDTYRVNGARNNIRFHGDRDANTFIIDGRDNTISIDNLGSDDRVVLEGPRSDWEIDDTGSFFDGTVRLRNKRTGNEVTVDSDQWNRWDNFTKDRLEFTGGYDNTLGARAPQEVIRDRRGTTGNVVDGHARNVKYVGDHGANSFRIRGTHNQVEVTELGSDDSVELEGPRSDWEIRKGENDGTIRYYNTRTHNSVTVSTDAGRGDGHVQDRVRFSGDYSTPIVTPRPPIVPQPPTWEMPQPTPMPPWTDITPMPWPNVGCPCHFPAPPAMPPMMQDPHFLQGLLMGFMDSLMLPGNSWVMPHQYTGPGLIWG
ncbi:MAG TPA: hypothetical protein RMG48_06330 [Myxococcales bacterium LLY-WYZ-16_1]|jgi:hypothetical protein|nr:hypothetical protein [Myxococcales bacterium LLY-WYZ-16_1]